MKKAFLATVVTIVLAAPPAFATFPGDNGRIAYRASSNKIFLTGSGQLTFPFPLEYDFDPAVSPDGSQVAFMRQSSVTNGYFYRLMVVRTDGSGLRQVTSSNAFPGLTTFQSIARPTWNADGQRFSFAVRNSGLLGYDGIWTTGGPEGTIHPIQGDASFPSWSPEGDRMLYRCASSHLCVYDAISGDIRQLSIDWPGTALGVGEPKWTPDGEKIVFFLDYITDLERFDVFSVNADGTGLTKLTDTGPDICPDSTSLHAPTFVYQSPVPSPDGKSIVAVKWRNTRTTGTGCTFTQEKGLSTFGVDGGLETLLLADPTLANGTDWQAIRGNLTLDIDDGHQNPLKGLKVELRRLDGTVVDDHPINTVGGTYVFESEIPPADHVVRATLVDNAGGPGSSPAFDIRHGPTPAEPVWLEMRITVNAASASLSRSFSRDVPGLVAYGPDSSAKAADRLDDMANIYFRTRQFVDWVKTHLTADTGPTVELYTFATADPWGDDVDPNAEGAYYNPPNTAIVLGVADSDYGNRDGVIDLVIDLSDPSSPAQRGHGDNGPANDEWHEFSHHLFFTFVNSRDDPSCATDYSSHGGYNNPDTCDSMDEGFSVFLPTLAAQEIEGTTSDEYDSFTLFLESNSKAYGYWQMLDPTHSMFVVDATREEFAVAALLWDFIDTNADTENGQIIGADRLHHPVTYTDPVTVPLRQLWSQLTSAHPATVFDFRSSFGQPDLTVDLDGDNVADIAPIDALFLMHGFFPVDTDQTIAGAHTTYHYDVGYAQMITPSARRNASVGETGHHVFDASGTETATLIPRFHTPPAPHAFLEIHVVNAQGIPLSGATLNMTIRSPGLERTVSRRLSSGDGNLVHLEVPPYFDYLLPTGAPLPACDPAHDFPVDVIVSATVNGVSSSTSSFDNCTYLHAIEAATGPAALAFTLTVPVGPGGTPEVCDGIDNDLDGLVDEDLGTLPCGVGACARTIDACVNGVPQVCTPGAPAAEICGDGLDNDCDGVVDNGCPPPPPADACTITAVLDNFNRADGSVGNNWRGVTSPGFYRLAGNRLDVQGGGPLYWHPATFGTSQAAFVTLSTVDPGSPSQGVLLKVQSSSVPDAGAILVVYDGLAKAVRVSTLRLGTLSWTPYGNTSVPFTDGDKLGACAKANGEVRVYRNDALVATVTLSATDQGFFNARGGKVGVWSVLAPRAFLDDFGGATIVP